MSELNSEQTLIKRLIHRDRKALTHFVRKYSDMIYNIVFGYVLNKEESEELTQDILLASLESLESFRGGSKLDTWIYRIAINRCLDFIKYKKRKKRTGRLVPISGYGIDNIGNEPVDYYHPGIHLESKEQMNALFKAIYRLPENQKSALILAKLDGQPQKKIAEIMGLTVKAVESLLTRSKRNLRKELNKIYNELNS